MQTHHFLSPLLSLLFTLLLIPFLRSLALKIKLIDLPNHRKVHEAPVPVIGGISIFLGTATALWALLPYHTSLAAYSHFFFASLLLLTMGVLDDRFDLNALLKLAIQLLLAHGIYLQGICIENLHGLFGIYALPSEMQYIFSILAIAGFMNALNLMDGIDGLAAGIAITGFTLLAILSAVLDETGLLLISTAILGSLMVFIRFNLSQKRKVFLGDAGSLILGFLLAVSGIHLLNAGGESPYASSTVFAVIAFTLLPVLDAMRVFIRRGREGKSLVHGDKNHLHHLVLSLGLKHRNATLLILFINVLMLFVGFLIFRYAGITLAALAMGLIFFAFTGLLRFNQRLQTWKARIRAMERRFLPE